MDIKEEPCFPDFCSESERDTEDLIKVKTETLTSSSDIKQEFEDSTCSQNKEYHLMRFNETITDSESETKIDIKEECWWLEREDSYVNDIKDEAHEDFNSTKPSLYKEEVSSCTSDLFSSEDLGNAVSFNRNMDRPECASDRKCEVQEGVVCDISSKETAEDGKIEDMVSALKESKLLQQNNTSKQDINNKDCKSVLSHEYRKPYICKVSKKCLIFSSHLEKLILIPVSKEASNCDVSNEGLNHFLSLKIHKVNDEREISHKCSVCNRAFSQSSDLKRHKLIHEGIRSPKCNICNKTFTRSSYLKTHKLIHEGIKAHKCDICSKAFTRSTDLNRHKLIHEGIKPHKCNICSKAFTLLSVLKRHNLIHKGRKPHKCSTCS